MARKIFMALLGFVSVIYLINPGVGVFELLPDNLPLVGNLDEALATALLIAVLREFDIDVTKFLRPQAKNEPKTPVLPR